MRQSHFLRLLLSTTTAVFGCHLAGCSDDPGVTDPTGPTTVGSGGMGGAGAGATTGTGGMASGGMGGTGGVGGTGTGGTGGMGTGGTGGMGTGGTGGMGTGGTGGMGTGGTGGMGTGGTGGMGAGGTGGMGAGGMGGMGAGGMGGMGAGGMGGGAPALIEVVYSTIATDPSSDVPGLAATKFKPTNSAFDRIFGTPNGNWALTALVDLVTSQDEVVIVNGVVETQEGMAASWTSGENVGAIDTRVGINSFGDFTFATNTTGPTTADDYIVVGMPAVGLTTAAREGDAASPPLPASAIWPALMETSVVIDDGTVGFLAKSVAGLPAGQTHFAVLGTSVLAQSGVTIPMGQIGNEPWENFDSDDFWVTPDGMHWLLQGDLTGATSTDDIVALDGLVVVQEGVILAGSGFAEPVDAEGIVGVFLAADGTYFVRGNNDVTEIDWIYSNGAVLASVGAPITIGATEVWSDGPYSDCFFLHVGNGIGDFVIGGVTDGPLTSNAVLVLNNTTVVAREGDPVDLNGNGLYDDNVFIAVFGNDDAFLDDAGNLYFIATLHDATLTVIGQALLTVKVF